MNVQNQGQPTASNLTAKNARAANTGYQQESASELAQSPGQISQLLLARSKAGFEFGSAGNTMRANNANNANNANAANARFEFGNMSGNLELNQSNGRMTKILANQSR